MLVCPDAFSLAHEVERVLLALPQLRGRATAETHMSAIELATEPHERAGAATAQLAKLRRVLVDGLAPLGLAAAAAGTHPFAQWHETVVSTGSRQKLVYGSMRELARREPTFALHVHVGVGDAERAVRIANRMRVHVPLLLALSANSPFWQGRDTGLASARTPLFQAFPRVGIPRAFEDFDDYVQTIDLLIRCGAFPEPTFLWWDVRLQPRFGTVEVRIMDAQTTVAEAGALVALVQSIARLEAEEGYGSDELPSPELLDENRFLAARDGVGAALIDPVTERTVPVRELHAHLVDAARGHAQDLGCADLLERSHELVDAPAASRQLALARGERRLQGLMAGLTAAFVAAT